MNFVHSTKEDMYPVPAGFELVSNVLGPRDSDYRMASKHAPQTQLCADAGIRVQFTRPQFRGESCFIKLSDVQKLKTHLDRMVISMFNNPRSKRYAEKTASPPPEPPTRLQILEAKIDQQTALIKQLLDLWGVKP